MQVWWGQLHTEMFPWWLRNRSGQVKQYQMGQCHKQFNNFLGNANMMHRQQRTQLIAMDPQWDFKIPRQFWNMSRRMTKLTKWPVYPAKTQISLGIYPVWSVFAVCMKKAWVLSYSLSTQWPLIRLGGCPDWSESSLGAQVILLVLSCAGSY